MSDAKKVSVVYFSDILCVWAYIAQARVDALEEKFSEQIQLQYHFISVFGSVESRINKDWQHRGGIEGYSEHVKSVVRQFDHVDVAADVWVKHPPSSSASCHLFLKAIQLLEKNNELPDKVKQQHGGKSVFEATLWALRLAFFKEGLDISNRKVQMDIGEKLGLPLSDIQWQIDSGFAHAALESDAQLKEKYKISGSPTFVLNEGRQIIYGNVGYRVIEANIKELLQQPENQASWC